MIPLSTRSGQECSAVREKGKTKNIVFTMFNCNIDLVIDVFLDKGNTKFTNSKNLKAHRPYTKVEKMSPVTYSMAFEHGQ